MSRLTEDDERELWKCVVHGFAQGFAEYMIHLFLVSLAAAVGIVVLFSSAKYLGWYP